MGEIEKDIRVRDKWILGRHSSPAVADYAPATTYVTRER